MIRAVRRLLPLACLALACRAAAATLGADGVPELSLCIEENPYPPLIYADRDGAIPILIKMAAREAGVRVQFHRAPYLRCLAEVRSGQADGYPSTAWAIDGAEAYAFPGHPGPPDPARATVTTRMMVYRRTGAAVQWDGKAFGSLALPVLHDRSGLLVAQRLKALGVKADNSAKNAEANLSKLVAGRGDAVVSFEVAATPLLRQPRFAGKVEVLPTPFFVETYYLGINHAVYARFRDKVEAMWQAIARLRPSAEYAAAIRDLPPQ
ncbi:substrate-binding periplasmic protein [Pseudoduganella sp. OTU4001]|uniref:substrate-binding periplasmic protein n=1 Tax=Pseudoduganella sp. OTU4001 TaxID=3043854 RepID=UPI00313DB39E